MPATSVSSSLAAAAGSLRIGVSSVAVMSAARSRSEQVGVPAVWLEVPHPVDLERLPDTAGQSPFDIEITTSAALVESNRLTSRPRQSPALKQPAVLDLGESLSPSGQIVYGGSDQSPAPDSTLSLQRLL